MIHSSSEASRSREASSEASESSCTSFHDSESSIVQACITVMWWKIRHFPPLKRCARGAYSISLCEFCWDQRWNSHHTLLMDRIDLTPRCCKLKKDSCRGDFRGWGQISWTPGLLPSSTLQRRMKNLLSHSMGMRKCFAWCGRNAEFKCIAGISTRTTMATSKGHDFNNLLRTYSQTRKWISSIKAPKTCGASLVTTEKCAILR